MLNKLGHPFNIATGHWLVNEFLSPFIKPVPNKLTGRVRLHIHIAFVGKGKNRENVAHLMEPAYCEFLVVTRVCFRRTRDKPVIARLSRRRKISIGSSRVRKNTPRQKHRLLKLLEITTKQIRFIKGWRQCTRIRPRWRNFDTIQAFRFMEPFQAASFLRILFSWHIMHFPCEYIIYTY